jgi:hypothetical protein
MNESKIKLREKNTEKNTEILKDIDKTQTKKCSICSETKELNEYSIHKGTTSGFYSWCLICSRKKDIDRNKIRKEYLDNDKKKCNTCDKSKTVLQNFSKKLGTTDGYSNICKDCGKIYRKGLAKELYQKKKHKLNTNIQFKLVENIRARIRKLLGNIKIKKPKTEKLIDCDLDSLVNHLQLQFYNNMSFDNYGEIWHLDHIIPCDWFDLTDINQIKTCTHYTNLQPLLIRDNSIKSNKIDWIHPKTGFQITFLRLVHSGFLSI